MIQKYIKVVLSLLCLLNLGISGSSDSGLTELVFERAGGGTMRLLWPIINRLYGKKSRSSLISIKLDGETIEVSVSHERIKCPDGIDRFVFDKPSVLDALKKKIVKSEIGCGSSDDDVTHLRISPEYELSYGDHILGEEEYFFNDRPLSLILPATCQLKIPRLSDIAAGNKLKILLNDQVIEVPVNPYESFLRLNQGKLEVRMSTFRTDMIVVMIVDKLVSEGIVADRRLCGLFTQVNPLITRALSATSITEENINAILRFIQKPIDICNSRPVYNTVKPSICVYTSSLKSSIYKKSINLLFTMPNTTNYDNFTSPRGQGEFGYTIMDGLLIALAEKYGELFLFQDGNKLKLFLDNNKLKVLKGGQGGQEIPLGLYWTTELYWTRAGTLSKWLKISMEVGDETTYQLNLCFEQTCCKDQENLVHLKWHRHCYHPNYVIDEDRSLIYRKDTPNGSDEVEWVTVAPEIIEKALVDIITELQSEAAANPVQSAESSV